jgi:hypothetical protein
MAKATGTDAPTAADFDEADDLFGADGISTGDTDFDEADDLLNSVEEDDAEGWVPTEREEAVSGVVVKVGETRSDFATSEEDAMCPTVTVLTKNGEKYRIIGYGAVLRRELQDANPKVGDLLAVKYWGEKPIKRGRYAGKMYKHFTVSVKHR